MIKGLENRVRVVELGKIKIGKKADDDAGRGWRAPQKLDHFVITTMERDAKGDLKPDTRLMQALANEQKCSPDQLKEIPIAFLSDDIEDVFPTAYVAYMGKVCVGRSDGETITWLADPKKNWEPLKEPRVVENTNRFVETHTYKDKRGNDIRLFKPHGTLNCVIAAADAKWGGVYKLRTTSIISIEQIYSGLVQVQQLTRGFLRNVPLRIVVRPMQVAPNGNATTVYVVHVELRGADLNAVQQHVIQAAQLEVQTGRALVAARSEYQKLLRAPGEDEDEDEQADVAEEFHPEVVTTTAVPTPAAPQAAPAPAPQPEPAAETPSPADALIARANAIGEFGPALTKLGDDIAAAAKSGAIDGEDRKRVSAAYAMATARASAKQAAPAVAPEPRETTPAPKSRKTPPPPPKRPDVVVPAQATPAPTATPSPAPAAGGFDLPF
jgi:hypothetical protein